MEGERQADVGCTGSQSLYCRNTSGISPGDSAREIVIQRPTQAGGRNGAEGDRALLRRESGRPDQYQTADKYRCEAQYDPAAGSLSKEDPCDDSGKYRFEIEQQRCGRRVGTRETKHEQSGG